MSIVDYQSKSNDGKRSQKCPVSEISDSPNLKNCSGSPPKLTGLSLKLNSIWNLVGNLVYASSQWGMLVVLAKLTGPDSLGRYALGLAITAPIMLLCQFQLSGIQASDVKGEFEFGDYFTFRILSTFFALLLIFTIALYGNFTFGKRVVIFSLGIAKSIESISDIFFGFLLRHERIDRVGKSKIIKGILSFIVFGSIIYVSKDLVFGILGYSITWGLLLVTHDYKISQAVLTGFVQINEVLSKKTKTLRPTLNFSKLVRIFKQALPLGFVAALVSLNVNIPRYIIEKNDGEIGLGIYAGLANLILIGTIIVVAIGQSAVPRLSFYYANGDKLKFKNLLFHLIKIGSLLAFAGVLISLSIGRPLLRVIYQPEYADHYMALVWLMIAGGISYIASFLSYGLLALRCYKKQLPLFVLVTLVTYITSVWAIPILSFYGAALSLMLGWTIQLIGSFYLISNELNSSALQNKPNESSFSKT